MASFSIRRSWFVLSPRVKPVTLLIKTSASRNYNKRRSICPRPAFSSYFYLMERRNRIAIGFVVAIISIASNSIVFACEEVKYDSNSPVYQYPKTQPLVFGKSFQVPSFKLRIIDSQTSKPLANAEIRVFYVWEWFMYPQYEKLFGGWEQAHESKKCALSNDGSVNVPTYKVITRGWYKGKWLLGRKPKFDHLVIQVPIRSRILTFHYSKKDLEKLGKQGKSQITLHVSE